MLTFYLVRTHIQNCDFFLPFVYAVIQGSRTHSSIYLSLYYIIINSCGGGERTRKRQNQTVGKCKNLKNFQCGKHLSEKEACNEGCVNGGTPNTKACSCTPAWTGTCCTKSE